jgi:hypothetical protein
MRDLIIAVCKTLWANKFFALMADYRIFFLQAQLWRKLITLTELMRTLLSLATQALLNS